MNNLKADKPNNTDYNAEPVFYCKHCLSLRIRDAGLSDLLFCDKCGSADILSTDIGTWENIYKEKYGFKFLDENFNTK